MPRHLIAALMLLASAAPTLAQNEPDRCYETTDPRGSPNAANTFYNPSTTLNWQRTLQMANPEAMAKIAGVYYGEQSNAQLGMIQRVYRSYEANGLWQYRDQTCSNNGLPCSQNQGAGQWAGYPQADGTIFVMIHFSDLSRYNNCVSETLRLDRDGMIDEASGSRWVRSR